MSAPRPTLGLSAGDVQIAAKSITVHIAAWQSMQPPGIDFRNPLIRLHLGRAPGAAAEPLAILDLSRGELHDLVTWLEHVERTIDAADAAT